jgi:hypothetical protein
MVSRVRLLAIAGSGRSGSTILGRTLAQIHGWIYCGELRLGFLALAANRLCACGVPAQECAFWRAVVEHAFGSFDLAMLERATELGNRVALNRHAVLHLSPFRSSRFRDEVAEYASIASKIYLSMQAISKTEVIIDTSKMPGYYLAMRESGSLDMYMVHLVRDSRAVAFSNRRKNLAPGNPNAVRYMPVQDPAVVAMGWNLKNAFVDVAMSTAGKSILLRYEDFIADPLRHIEAVIDMVGSKQRPPEIRDGTIEIGTDHSLAGNPIRFDRGAVRLRVDDEWRAAMRQRHQALVTTLTWPMLMAYGYMGRWRSEGGAESA